MLDYHYLSTPAVHTGHVRCLPVEMYVLKYGSSVLAGPGCFGVLYYYGVGSTYLYSVRHWVFYGWPKQAE
ncbi:hypothetical protein BO94DRAFT_534019 [Aspergillus sclerotioniger CBS 115572]|uniref:Uncharacterized protein n=1 Tax=Aspergillus sclerotioniger CBS 115572 TaxID=1450535 RepID=A0A317WZ26_9EURO|nr:hypothetical protein BO94DRAFT_534019 [Aspergillus sclerotioniger CBS 115572]PWY90517.1 hypothetical protein BO94DRAFT_534019 [Aspergillus sclerotioniger CBS 115572]